MSSPPPPGPKGAGEYLELLNLGPGAAAVETLALVGQDGVLHPLLASAPPLPVRLLPGERALAVGASFEAERYHLPPGTPVLRAATQRLLGHGLSGEAPPPLRIVFAGPVPVELASFPGSSERCAPGASLQRDETAPPGAPAAFHCGQQGGTPGAPP